MSGYTDIQWSDPQSLIAEIVRRYAGWGSLCIQALQCAGYSDLQIAMDYIEYLKSSKTHDQFHLAMLGRMWAVGFDPWDDATAE